MKCALKIVTALLIACLNIKPLPAMHNPMIRKTCALGEHLECRARLFICWKYYCHCDADHVALGLGLGCLYYETVNKGDQNS